MRLIEKPEGSPERIAIYGPPKTGKTKLALALPWGTEKWGEAAAYVPYDPNGEGLKGVDPSDAQRVRQIVPEGKPDWLEEAVAIALTDWRKQWPEVKTLIIDTMTVFSQRLLRQYADSGVFSDKHAVQVGNRQSKSWHTSPMEGDYGAAQNSVSFVLDHLWTQPLNLIVIFHDGWVEPKGGDPAALQGGPEVVGRKAIRWIPGRFDSVLRTERVNNPQGAKYVVHTAQKGIWVAGVRSRKPLPPVIEVPIGQQRGVWEAYDGAV